MYHEELTEKFFTKCIRLADSVINDELEVDDGMLTVKIEPTGELDAIMDVMREDDGYNPFFHSQYGDELDEDGTYDFFAYLTRHSVDALHGVPVGSDSEDDGYTYDIPLNVFQKGWLHDRIKALIGYDEWERLFGEDPEKKIEKKKVVVYVEGGMVTSVWADSEDIDVEVVDRDCLDDPVYGEQEEPERPEYKVW